jgi:hypothetical protein
MPTVYINKFDGGHAEDNRTFATDQCEECLNFDIYTNPHKLIPIRGNTEEIISSVDYDMNEIRIADVGIASVSGTPTIVGVGKSTDVLAAPSFYTKTIITDPWLKVASGTGTYAPGTLVIYRGLPYVLSTNGDLQKWSGAVSTVGNNAGTNIGSSFPRPYVHPEDNVLYTVIGNIIGKWDASTYTAASTILPDGMTASSITHWGGYLAIAMRPTYGIGNSYGVLWGRDTTINTLQGVIDFGEGDLRILENLGEVLVGLVYSRTNFSSTISYKIDVKVYSGGSVTTVKSIPIPAGADNTYPVLKLKKDDKLYFAIGGNSTAIWCVYKNKEGYWVVTKERYFRLGTSNAADLAGSPSGLSLIGDIFYLGYFDSGGTYRLQSTTTTPSYIATSKYKTTVNPNMVISDRFKSKTLEAVHIAITGSATGSAGLSYSVDGSDMTSIISEPNSLGEYVVEASAEAGGKPFATGREFQFLVESSGGAQIKEIRYRYKVVNDLV